MISFFVKNCVKKHPRWCSYLLGTKASTTIKRKMKSTKTKTTNDSSKTNSSAINSTFRSTMSVEQQAEGMKHVETSQGTMPLTYATFSAPIIDFSFKQLNSCEGR